MPPRPRWRSCQPLLTPCRAALGLLPAVDDGHGLARSLGEPAGLFLEEVAATGLVEQLARDDRRFVLVAADVDHLLDDVARMTAAHLEPARLVVATCQVLDDDRVVGDALPLQIHREIR